MGEKGGTTAGGEVFCAGIQNAHTGRGAKHRIIRRFRGIFSKNRQGKTNKNAKSRIFSRFLSNFQLRFRIKRQKAGKRKPFVNILTVYYLFYRVYVIVNLYVAIYPGVKRHPFNNVIYSSAGVRERESDTVRRGRAEIWDHKWNRQRLPAD